MKNQIRLLSGLMVVVLAILACNSPTPTPGSNSDSSLYQTQTALALTLTALNNNPPAPTQQPPLVIPNPTETPQAHTFTIPTETQQPPILATATDSTLSSKQIQDKIASANILIYEDIAGDPYYITFVSKAAAKVGGNRVYVGDAMGTFMNKLNSSTKWDLIIVASEYRSAISGDYWTAIKQQIDNGVAVIAEVWYLDSINSGKITPLLDECGIEFQKNWYRGTGFNPIDYDMYWIYPNSPVFNTPNQVDNFTYTIPDPWMGDAGDFLQLAPGSNSLILASHSNGHKTDLGLLTSCLDGRVLFQTFSSHDYPSDPMIKLWENYITFTLTNHFQFVH